MIYLIYIFGALTMLFGILTAVLYHKERYRLAKDAKMTAAAFFLALGAASCALSPVNGAAAAVIYAGFIPSFAGDYFLAKKEYPLSAEDDFGAFSLGVASFAIAQILYFVGFMYAAGWRLSPLFIPLAAYSLIPTVGGIASKFLSVEKKRLPIMIGYGILLSLTLFASASRYHLYPSTGSLLALIGSICFCLSDTVLGSYYFANINIDKKLLNYPIMALYFAAQILYAFSLLYA